MTPPPTNTASKLRFSVKTLPPPALPGSGQTVGDLGATLSARLQGSRSPSDATHCAIASHNQRVSFAPPEGQGPLRRERLRTARLYFVCDARPGGVDPEPLLRAALGGGVDIVQLREKQLGRAEIERAASTFRRIADTYSALFIVNDDPDLARACDADGVHVGQDDASVEEARAMLGPEMIIGQSTHSEEQIAAAEARDIDYFAVGPVWETPTKPGRPAVGLELVTHAAEARRPSRSSRSAGSAR